MSKTAVIPEAVAVEKPEPKKGLSKMQVLRRQEAGLTNAAPQGAGKTNKEIVFSHCFTFFNLVFLVLAAFLAIVGSFKNMTFLIVAAINTVIGFVQEIRAKRAVEKLTWGQMFIKVLRQVCMAKA